MSIFRRKERRACPSNTPRPCLQGVPLAALAPLAFTLSTPRDLEYFDVTTRVKNATVAFVSDGCHPRVKESTAKNRPNLFEFIFLSLVATYKSNRKYRVNKLARKSNCQSRLKKIDHTFYTQKYKNLWRTFSIVILPMEIDVYESNTIIYAIL